MCLRTISHYETLTKDLKIYKVVHGTVCEFPEFYGGDDYASKRNHIALRRWVSMFTSLWEKTKHYRAGFHGFLTRYAALKWMEGAKYKRIATYIIPKGTKVLFGEQDHMKCVVSPIMINPRVKEKK